MNNTKLVPEIREHHYDAINSVPVIFEKLVFTSNAVEGMIDK